MFAPLPGWEGIKGRGIWTNQQNAGVSGGQIPGMLYRTRFAVHPSAPRPVRNAHALRSSRMLDIPGGMDRKGCILQAPPPISLRPWPVRRGQAVQSREMLAFRTMRDRRSCPIQVLPRTGPYIISHTQYEDAMPPGSTKFRLSVRSWTGWAAPDRFLCGPIPTRCRTHTGCSPTLENPRFPVRIPRKDCTVQMPPRFIKDTLH